MDSFTGASSLRLLTSTGLPIGGSCTGAEVCRPGATSIEDALDWVRSALCMIEANSQEACGSQLMPELLAKLSAGVHLLTDYSGFGGPEEALNQIVEDVEQLKGISLNNVRSLRAGDIDAVCRSILAAHDSNLRPSCVFGDILDRRPAGDVTFMHEARARATLQVEACVSKLARKRAAVKASASYFRKVSKHMIKGGRVNRDTLTAHCYVHGQPCRLFPRRGTGCRAIRAGVAGITCQPWSCMGTRTGWLGVSSLPFFQCMSELLDSDTDLVILKALLISIMHKA